MSDYEARPNRGQGNLDSLSRGMNNMSKVLAQMGWPALREGQKKPIYSIMSEKDVLCVLPTSAGKTGCFVVPTLCMGWRTIVFSPMIALMRDQTQAMQRAGVQAACINSDNTAADNADVINRWMRGELQIMLVAPERAKDESWLQAMKMVPPDLVALDEAHTLPHWAHTFRPSYKYAGKWVQDTCPKVVAAFTATCPEGMDEGIKNVLRIEHADVIRSYPRRKNLHLHTAKLPAQSSADDFYDVAEWVYDTCTEPGGTIIYCATPKQTEEMAAALATVYNPGEYGFYHGKANASTKKFSQDQFLNGRMKVLAATPAFGMGVDKPDVRYVVHWCPPSTIEELAQETGRAGRDGADSWCYAMSASKGIRTREFLIRNSNPDESDVRSFYDVLIRSEDPTTGNIVANRNEVADNAGVSRGRVGAVMSFLYGEEILMEVTSGNPMFKVTLKRVTSAAAKHIELRDAIYEIGVENEDASISFSLEALADYMERTEATVKKYIMAADAADFLDVTPPDKRKIVKRNRNIDTANFDTLNKNSSEAMSKFEAVRRYFEEVPDEEKHEYMESFLAAGTEVIL